MQNSSYFEFETIYIERKIKNHRNTRRILGKIKNNPRVVLIDDVNRLVRTIPAVYHPRERSKNLLLSGIRGDILQKCPGSHGHICCNYYIINLYVGCPLDCAYCILQSYLNQPFTIINVDIERIFKHLKSVFRSNPRKHYRIGTGELGDSLAYDYLTDFSPDFIDFFSAHKNASFEFKTKTDFVENMLSVDSPGNIVAGFSVNPGSLINRIETGAANIDRRLVAAKKLQEKGYMIALHFDPVINIDDFDLHYYGLIDKIFNYVDPRNTAWISLGTFRYTPHLKGMMEYNYPDAGLLNEEFLENNDRKYRYFLPVRIGLYRKIIDRLKRHHKEPPVYLCMESPFVWQNTVGYLPFEECRINPVFR